MRRFLLPTMGLCLLAQMLLVLTEWAWPRELVGYPMKAALLLILTACLAAGTEAILLGRDWLQKRRAPKEVHQF